MSTRLYDTDLTTLRGLLLRRFCQRRDREDDRAPPTFVPSSMPSFTYCGQADISFGVIHDERSGPAQQGEAR